MGVSAVRWGTLMGKFWFSSGSTWAIHCQFVRRFRLPVYLQRTSVAWWGQREKYVLPQVCGLLVLLVVHQPSTVFDFFLSLMFFVLFRFLENFGVTSFRSHKHMSTNQHSTDASCHPCWALCIWGFMGLHGITLVVIDYRPSVGKYLHKWTQLQ